jgi:hypothetical protein
MMQELVRLSDKIESLEGELKRSRLSSRPDDDGATAVEESDEHGPPDRAAGPVSEGG